MKIGIVGLPNVGKSTLFNALTGSSALVANYAFTTIQPNLGVVPLPDGRLDLLSTMIQTGRVVPATLEFVDIAGLVEGASLGEGLGNQFLSHIREVDALLHLVRCFEDESLSQVMGSVDPVRDFQIVETELLLADLAHLEKRLARMSRAAKSQDPRVLAEVALVERLMEHLNRGEPARSFKPDRLEPHFLEGLSLLTLKPVLVAANVSELTDLETDPCLGAMVDFAGGLGVPILPVVAGIEAEIAELPADEQALFREELGYPESSLARVIREGFHLLDLISFFTANEKELRAWTVKRGTQASRAAGIIHSDFERGFIRAEVIAFEDLNRSGSLTAAREKGLMRSEGRSYLIQDGDYVFFRFNV